MKDRPELQLVGHDGNIYAIMGSAAKLLRRAGMREEADEMFKLCVGGVIDKTRWIVPYEGHIFEVDEFHGINDGLLFAEVELKTEDEHFEKPPFLGPEVTGNRHFYNSHLLVNPYPQWRETVPEEYR